MSAISPTASRSEIENEIVFYTVLLTTLDPDADDFLEKKAEYDAALADLEARLNRPGENVDRPQTPASQVSNPAASHSAGSYALPSRERNGTTHTYDYAPVSPSLGNQDLTWNWPEQISSHLGSGTSTPSSSASNANKRPRDSFHTSHNHQKKHKLNGDTAGSAISTPATIDSDEELVEKHPGLKAAAINREGIMKKMQEQEAQRLARLKVERNDRDMALLVSQSLQGPSASTSASQSYFDPRGQYQRPPPPPKPAARPSVPERKPDIQAQPLSRPQFVPSSSLPSQSFGDYNNDDDDDDDIQIISHDQFAQSFSRPRAPTRHPNQGLQNYSSPHSLQSNSIGGTEGYNGMRGGSSVYGNEAAASSSAWPSYNILQQGAAALWNGMSSAIGLNNGDLWTGTQGPSGYPGHRRTFEEALEDRGFTYMLADPSKTKEELEALLENIRPDEDIPPEMRIGTPRELGVSLMEHQKLGLAWLQGQEDGTNKGGILADDMGLGKTIQALALIATRPSEDPSCKTTLIIAPVALMRQWKKEIETKMSPRHRLSVYVMHGKQKRVTFAKLSTFDVVITTFGTVASEYTRKITTDTREAGSSEEVRRKTDENVLLGRRSKWHRVIVDEAQMIKNKDTKAALGCLHLDATYRLCMTGTPMMNNIGELFSLIRFLRIAPYSDFTRFSKDFKRPIQGFNETEKQKAMRLLQGLLKAILLRRTKKSEIDGKPILQLPDRVTEVVHAVFDEEQEKFYRAIEQQSRLEVSKYLKAGKIGRNYSYVLVRLLRLRQACCHPHLIKDFTEDAPGDVTKEEMSDFVKNLSNEVTARIKATDGQFECPICYDAVGNPTIFFPCGHDCCFECFARITDPSLAMQQGNENVEARCPECRSKLDIKKVFDYNAFKAVHMPEEGDAGTVPEGEDEDLETDSESDLESDDESDADSQGDLRDFIVADDASVHEEESDDEDTGVKEERDSEAEEGPSRRKKPAARKADKKINKPKMSKKAKGKQRKEKKKKTLADLRKEGLKNAAAKKRYLRRLRRDWVSSCKVDKTMEILRNIRKTSGEKTIIFSQFTSFLDLLEVPIDGDDIDYRRYDGSMSAKMRNKSVEEFQEKPNVTVMLVSLKAGNAGLNLTAASQVIILDPFWNPFIEEQAIDRAHRIGQRRTVQVHRVLVQGTVEDRIIELQERKREMINEALDEKAAKNVSRLGREELRYLFGISSRLGE